MDDIIVVSGGSLERLDGLLNAVATYAGRSEALAVFDKGNPIHEGPSPSFKAVTDLIVTLNLAELFSVQYEAFTFEVASHLKIDTNICTEDEARALELREIGKKIGDATRAAVGRWRPGSRRRTKLDSAFKHLGQVYNALFYWVDRNSKSGTISEKYFSKIVYGAIAYEFDLWLDDDYIGDRYIDHLTGEG